MTGEERVIFEAEVLRDSRGASFFRFLKALNDVWSRPTMKEIPKKELEEWKNAIQRSLEPPFMDDSEATFEERSQVLAYLNLRLASYLKP